MLTFSIYEVGDCGFQSYQTEIKMKRATALEFITISPILYIHCCAHVAFVYSYFIKVNRYPIRDNNGSNINHDSLFCPCDNSILL